MTLTQPVEQIDLGPGEDDFHIVCSICYINDTGDGPKPGIEYVITACGIGLDVGDYAEQEDTQVDCAACFATLRVRGHFPCGHSIREVIAWCEIRNIT